MLRFANCTLPPKGWHCTRDAGHDGPCAALPNGCTNCDVFEPLVWGWCADCWRAAAKSVASGAGAAAGTWLTHFLYKLVTQ